MTVEEAKTCSIDELLFYLKWQHKECYCLEERCWQYNDCEYRILLDRIKEALEKQIPKKPIDVANSTYCKCPVCGNFHFDNYCANCGQKIDWSEDDDDISS